MSSLANLAPERGPVKEGLAATQLGHE